jgi:hypothetical protein
VKDNLYALTPKSQEDIQMANKNYSGNILNRQKNWESRIVDKIDRRDKNGKNRENVDDEYNNFTTTKDGSKVWSF